MSSFRTFAIMLCLSFFVPQTVVLASPSQLHNDSYAKWKAVIDSAYDGQQRSLRYQISEILGLDPKYNDDAVKQIIESVKNRETAFVNGTTIRSYDARVEKLAQFHATLEKVHQAELERVYRLLSDLGSLDRHERKEKLKELAQKVEGMAFDYRVNPETFTSEKLFELRTTLEKVLILLDAKMTTPQREIFFASGALLFAGSIFPVIGWINGHDWSFAPYAFFGGLASWMAVAKSGIDEKLHAKKTVKLDQETLAQWQSEMRHEWLHELTEILSLYKQLTKHTLCELLLSRQGSPTVRVDIGNATNPVGTEDFVTVDGELESDQPVPQSRQNHH